MWQKEPKREPFSGSELNIAKDIIPLSQIRSRDWLKKETEVAKESVCTDLCEHQLLSAKTILRIPLKETQ